MIVAEFGAAATAIDPGEGVSATIHDVILSLNVRANTITKEMHVREVDRSRSCVTRSTSRTVMDVEVIAL